MGAPISDILRYAPPNSFIHVDQFDSQQALAAYLKYLDNNNTAYAEYLAWHLEGKKAGCKEVAHLSRHKLHVH
ncbi:unnamed protein product [Protopolystoma xenopodis]|uniref:Fucosyltransferase n=1 Tax=Protopolystoma xenopodis TaxID=117903 RepID=A0A3S5ALC9_9PLAT|nr:unnamed protein product [Protopolystoma xenopodis]